MKVYKNNGLISIQLDDGRVVEVPFKHRDARRTIWEGHYGDGVIQYFQIHASNMPLARHYHRLVTETFTILSGGGYLLTSSVDYDGMPIDAEGNLLPEMDSIVMRRHLELGDTVEVAPFLAHTFYLRLGTEMVCIASHPFDIDDVLPTAWLVM